VGVFIAFGLALASLWYTQWKGPDIDFLQEPGYFFDSTLKVDPDNIPSAMRFKSERLVFVNSGTRAGALILKASFEPSQELKQFWDGFYHYFKMGDLPVEFPIAVRERETCILTFDYGITLPRWKHRFDCKPVDKEHLGDALRQVDEQNEKHFAAFCRTLELGTFLGRFSLTASYTTRKKWIPRNLIENFATGQVDRRVIDQFRNGLEKWDDIQPNYVLDEARSVGRTVSEMRKFLEQMVLDRSLDQIDFVRPGEWGALIRSIDGYETRGAILEYVLDCVGLKAGLQDFGFVLNSFDEFHRRYKETERPTQDQQNKLIERLERLKRERSQWLMELTFLENTLLAL